MRLLGIAILIAIGSVTAQAQTTPNGCPKEGAALSHSQAIAQDPTVPATIGGCGLGKYKLHQYKKQQKELQEQQLMIGPKATGSGENL